MIEVKVFQSHDNTFSLQITSQGTPVNLINTGVSRVVVKVGSSNQVDSDINPEAIDWITNGTDGKIEFIFSLLDLPIGIHSSQLVVYDGSHILGQVIGDKFQIDISEQVVLEI